MIRAISFLTFQIISISLYSQSIANVVAKQNGDNVIISYNLQCERDAQISLFLSEDGDGKFIGPLKSVSGDVGNNIKSGYKTIIWNPLQETDIVIGNNIIFRIKGDASYGSFTDSRDGKTYKAIKIGNQTVMNENLAFKVNRDCFDYYKNGDLVAKYGYLYTWESAKNACPTGWHLPSDLEWTTLTSFLGNESVAGGKLKESGTSNWKSPNAGATNESGFTALPGGCYADDGVYLDIGKAGYWWSSTESNFAFARSRSINYKSIDINRNNSTKQYGFSVRCFRDF